MTPLVLTEVLGNIVAVTAVARFQTLAIRALLINVSHPALIVPVLVVVVVQMVEPATAQIPVLVYPDIMERIVRDMIIVFGALVTEHIMELRVLVIQVGMETAFAQHILARG
jgi:hypothetical protein